MVLARLESEAQFIEQANVALMDQVEKRYGVTARNRRRIDRAGSDIEVRAETENRKSRSAGCAYPKHCPDMTAGRFSGATGPPWPRTMASTTNPLMISCVMPPSWISCACPIHRGPLLPRLNDDPGRFRNEAFFKRCTATATPAKFRRILSPDLWLPRSWGKAIQVTRTTSSDHLRQVSDEIDPLEPS